MKKTNFFYAAGLMMVCAFGVQSCTVEDNAVTEAMNAQLKSAPVSYNYDFANAGKQGVKINKQNGNQSNGQGFYAWEKADKTDSKRNDYKGYSCTDGADLWLPAVCHIWGREEIHKIDANGINITQDRQLAIDGLQAGSKVQIFYTAPEFTEKVSLKTLPFGSWSAWVGGELTAPSDPDWNEGTSSGQPYGDGSVIRFADLSQYAKLIVKCTEGTPRFLFNRDIDEGQWAENEAESHLIDNTKGGWSAKYFTSEEADGVTTWTVDIAQMVKDKGYAHLHAIKGANWQNCTLTSMEVETLPATRQLVWAIGDGTSSDGPGADRTTATIDGTPAITGVTPIASGATIEVQTVTPAVKGTGYIVFKVYKGMVIKQIRIENAVN